ncbi:organic solute transporter subunit alpha/Transmembrane protein [Hyaloraphidium curvatum]|nr:organic solute transporter subunit alpha/Transmembrane protein [Hyaloraphidium curvatum]
MAENSTLGRCFASEDGTAFKPDSPFYGTQMFAWVATMLFSVVATAFSVRLMLDHFKRYHRPELQRHVIRLVLMVPLFATLSCISFRLLRESAYLDVLRDAYEAVALYSFYCFMVTCLGPDEESQRARFAGQPNRAFPFPFGCMSYNPRGHAFLVNTKILLLQYPVSRTVLTVIALILHARGFFCEETFSPLRFRFWFVVLNFSSSTITLYALLVLNSNTHETLRDHKPLYKVISRLGILVRPA